MSHQPTTVEPSRATNCVTAEAMFCRTSSRERASGGASTRARYRFSRATASRQAWRLSTSASVTYAISMLTPGATPSRRRRSGSDR
jgi:hypothetical protein